MNKANTKAETGEGTAPSNFVDVDMPAAFRSIVNWSTWMNCLPQSRIDRIAFKTGFKTIDGGFNPDKSGAFNEAVNVARAQKLGLI